MKRTKTQRLTLMTMLLAMSIVLHMIEPSMPIPIPGVKLGLANIIGLIAFYLFGAKEMIIINFMRVLLASLLRGVLFSTPFWVSLSGVALSTMMVIIVAKLFKPSVPIVSVVSAGFHGIGQVIAISMLYSTFGMVYYLPMLLGLSIPTGVLTGFIADQALNRLKK